MVFALIVSVLQCVAVCCSVLQCVAVCCSVLQCVAVCEAPASEFSKLTDVFLQLVFALIVAHHFKITNICENRLEMRLRLQCALFKILAMCVCVCHTSVCVRVIKVCVRHCVCACVISMCVCVSSVCVCCNVCARVSYQCACVCAAMRVCVCRINVCVCVCNISGINDMTHSYSLSHGYASLSGAYVSLTCMHDTTTHPQSYVEVSLPLKRLHHV